MSEFLAKAFAEYGVQALSWVLVALGGLLAKYLWNKIKSDWARGVVSRAYEEIKGAVMEVAQSYADDIKAKNADGKLTQEERDEAKELALKIAKENIGTKGLKRLARILGLDSIEQWIANKTEAAVRSLPPSK